MKLKPIIFNDDMVRAILSGTKTQTRRPLILRNTDLYADFKVLTIDDVRSFEMFSPGYWHGHTRRDGTECCGIKSKVFVGDVLWVRECWSRSPFSDNAFVHRADFESPELVKQWKPSIHMPGKAARIFLRVNKVRIERLDDITADDAVSEGFVDETQFKLAWYSIYGPDKFGANPWLWVYEFERIEMAMR